MPTDLSTNYSLSSTLKDQLWDSAITMLIVGGTPEVREVIFQLLRLQHFIAKYATSLEVKALQKLAHVQVSLPKSVFPLPKEKYVPPTPPAVSNEAHPLEVLSNEFSAKNEATQTLEKLHKRQEKSFRKNSTENTVRDTLTQEKWDEMSSDLKALLTAHDIEVGDSLLASIQILIASTQVTFAKMWENAPTQRKVVVANGGVYAQHAKGRDPFGENTNPVNPTVRDFDDPYENFYAADRPHLRCILVGDYLRIEQTLCCYEPAEIAHIENVLQGEMKENSVRQFQQYVSEESSSSESEEEKVKDTQSSDRYEMQKEMDKTSQFDASLSLGASVSGPSGPVTVSANANFASSYSTSQSEHQAVSYAKDLTERTLNRIQKRIKQERKTKTTQEVEIINKHIIDNSTNTTGHVVGIYRWVEKIYNAQVMNYGTRLMMEFNIPEPAAFYLWVMVQRGGSADAITLDEPIAPNAMQCKSLMETML